MRYRAIAGETMREVKKAGGLRRTNRHRTQGRRAPEEASVLGAGWSRLMALVGCRFRHAALRRTVAGSRPGTVAMPSRPDLLGGLAISPLGLGCSRRSDRRIDAAYRAAIESAVHPGLQSLRHRVPSDAALKRSEATLGRALANLFAAGVAQRDEIIVASKAGFILTWRIARRPRQAIYEKSHRTRHRRVRRYLAGGTPPMPIPSATRSPGARGRCGPAPHRSLLPAESGTQFPVRRSREERSGAASNWPSRGWKRKSHGAGSAATACGDVEVAALGPSPITGY